MIGERRIGQSIMSSLTIGMVLLLAFLPSPAISVPPITNPYCLTEATIEGAQPETVDPAWAYEIASSGIMFNIYETLLTHDGERVDSYIPNVAADWTLENMTGSTSPEGISWYYRYVFRIEPNVTFQQPYNYTLNSEDVEYSFERAMVQDRSAGPTWMFYEPLFNGWGAAGLGNLSNAVDIARIGKMIDHAVEQNGTHVWFNIGFPRAYAPFMQILCQSWSSIMSKQWVNNIVIGQLHRPDWSGDWMIGGDHVEWINHHDLSVSPLDDPTPLMYGSGPFILQTLDYTNNYCEMTRNTGYWRGWPADWPMWYGSRPAGYVSSFNITWAFDWATRKTMFLNGEVDFCPVPRQYMGELHQNPTPPFAPPNYPLDGIREIQPLPNLAMNALFFTFNVDSATPYGNILPAGTFNESGIPSDFFGNSEWGIRVRKAFAHAIDYSSYNTQAYVGEACHLATAIVPGLPFYDPTIQGYDYNLTRTAEEFQATPGFWESGFSMTYVYAASSHRQTLGELIKGAIEGLNPKFHITLQVVSWSSYLKALNAHQLATFSVGWLADYPDPHNFAYSFYHSAAAFPQWQAYGNQTMDELVDAGVEEPDVAVRAVIYHNIQALAVEDCPSAALVSVPYRHFERDWVCGWYYNPGYQGTNAYVLWKWYYAPHASANNSAQPTSNCLPADIDYNGKINIKDVSIAARSFGSSYGPPVDPRWMFRCDINNDRKIDIRDIVIVAANFGKTFQAWNPH